MTLPAISLRVSLTDACQFRCVYCRPPGTATPSRHAPVPPATWIRRIRRVQSHATIEKLRFTGGEPLLYPHLEAVIGETAELGIADLSMTTNALGLAPIAIALREAGLRRVNISLDSLDPDTFSKMNANPLAPVLAGVDAALEAGLRVKLNAVILRGHNDEELLDLAEYATEKGVTLRYLELMPIGPTARDFDALYVSGAEMKERLGEHLGWSELPYRQGETSRDFRGRWPDGRELTCGFILPTSRPFCEGCRRLRLTADGRMAGCLAQPDRFDLEEVEAALAAKERPQRFAEQSAMVSIGG